MEDFKNYIYLEKAAKRWDDGLPIGNGRLGGMIMGKVKEETIIINEETLWYGPMRNRMNKDGKTHIKDIRELLINGEVEKASFLAKMSMTSTPKYNNPYQPAGELRLCFMNHQNKAKEYKRMLDIDNAIASVSYQMNGVQYKREHFVSIKYNVLAIKITSDSNEGITLSANIGRKPFEENSGVIDEASVGNWGQNGVGGVEYFTGVRMVGKSFDNVSNPVKTMGDFVYAESAKEVVIFLAAGTNFLDILEGNTTNSVKDVVINQLRVAESIGYEKMKQENIKEYHKLYDRFSLSINNVKSPSLPTNYLLAKLREGDLEYSDYLIVLLVNYARYLMISSSYQCELPANLQGIWNGSFEPPWQSEFTININEEMNYWFVEKVSLPECHLPLFKLIKRLVKNGQKTAREFYGCRGFCAHHNTNIWACTDMEGIFDASPFWVMGGAWLSLHMYEHYLYTKDEVFLKEEALPVMKEAILFFQDYLYEDSSGYLLTGPTLSPENTYISDKGQKGALCMAPTMDSTILRQLINWYMEGNRIIGEVNKDEVQKLDNILKKLPPLKTSKDGRILEWHQEYEETEPGHRHISHMFALHPGIEITKDKKEFYEGAKNTIDYRLSHGGGHTGWSKAWLACFMARLHSGDELYDNIIGLLERCIQDNMLDLHPPFQIDGNFGIAEAIIEGLVQSHGGYIELLPALPSKWKTGSLLGVRLRGAISADIIWNNGELESCVLTADQDCNIEVRYKDKKINLNLKHGIKTEVVNLFVK